MRYYKVTVLVEVPGSWDDTEIISVLEEIINNSKEWYCSIAEEEITEIEYLRLMALNKACR